MFAHVSTELSKILSLMNGSSVQWLRWALELYYSVQILTSNHVALSIQPFCLSFFICKADKPH